MTHLDQKNEGWELVLKKGTAYEKITSADPELYKKMLSNLHNLIQGELIKHNTTSETELYKIDYTEHLMPKLINLIQIKIHTDKELKGMVEIESDPYDILYSSPWESHHGMQCNFAADSPEYNKLFELCTQIEKAVREIHKLYETQNGK
jgi:hypothetical protein